MEWVADSPKNIQFSVAEDGTITWMSVKTFLVPSVKVNFSTKTTSKIDTTILLEVCTGAGHLDGERKKAEKHVSGGFATGVAKALYV
jgi:hypothetical protein